MSIYSIRDLEQLSGIKAHTLRIWEQRYNILNPERTDTNIRTYTGEDLKLVLNISLLREHGHKISNIAKISLEEMSKEVMAISDKQVNYPDQIQSLTISMVDLDEERFEKLMSTNILKFGLENTMINIIYPFLTRIGMLWVTGSIGPAQEHFISNLIRQKIIVATDAQVVKLNENSKTFVLYLPEGELHEIGLLFANYILRSKNHKVIYLGQSLPFNELAVVCEIHKPDYMFSVITSVPSQDEVQEYVNRLAEHFSNIKILLTGYQIVGQGLKLSENVEVINNVNDIVELANLEI